MPYENIIEVLEIGFNQKERLNKIVDELYGTESDVSFYKDLDGNDRICVIQFA